MDGFTVAGAHGFTACELRGGATGQLSSAIDVVPDTPALYAAIGDPATGRVLDPATAVLTVTDPDGITYTAAANTATQFAVVTGGRLQVLYLARPLAGRWRIGCSAAAPADFRAMLATVPVPGGDPLTAALAALAPRFPGDTSGSAQQVAFGLLRWGMWPLAVALVTARATTDLALDLTAVVADAFGVDAASAARAVSAMAGQAAPGALLTIASEGGLIPPGTALPALVNGAAADGLAGWEITANGGDGWAVQSGYSGALGYRYNFAASFGWCEKRQVVDLVGQVGLTPARLDTAPAVTVTDWVAAPVPDGTGQPSSYRLTARLLDAAGTPVKEVTTGTVALAPAGPRPQWQRVQLTFSGYGPGVRAVSFTHGGQDAQQWAGDYGVKMTGAEVSVQLEPPGDPPIELLTNGSGQDGTAGWTNTSPSGNPWAVDPAAGIACPASPGATAFTVAAGAGVQQQIVDLVTAGLRPDFLDTSPPLQAGQWIASAPGSACSYGFVAELLDADRTVLATLDIGTVRVDSAPRRFSPLFQTISDYPAGLRSIRFSHRAQPAVDGQGPACVTGATLRILVPQPPPQPTSPPPALSQPALPQVEPSRPEPPDAGPPGAARSRAVRAATIAGAAAPVADPASRPFWWVCRLRMFAVDGATSYLGSGALIRSPDGWRILTAAHNMVERWPITWMASIDAYPGAGTKGTARGMALQLPIEFLLHNQAAVAYNGSYDYGLVRASASDWQMGGFVPTAEDDPAMQDQSVTVTAFPADAPFASGTMYTENATLSVYDGTQATVTSTFTRGASGGPVYVRGTTKVVGVFSHGALFGWATPYMRRTDARAIGDAERWSRELDAGDRVCSLQLVIHTGDEAYAGTDDPICLTLGGHRIDLDPLWMPLSGSVSDAKERGHFDGYDLSSALRDAFPDGLLVGSLAGMPYELRRTSEQTWMDGDWFVGSLNFYVNGCRYHMHNTNRWLYFNRPPWDVISGTLP